jgi:Haem-binding domain
MRIKMNKVLATAVLGITASLLIAQSFRYQHTNPPSKGDLAAPPEVAPILRRACYDCHSNETRWPWYTYIAPVSWLIERDVALGRKELNFSEWESYYPATRVRKLQWIDRALREEAMPSWIYRMLHPGAALTQEDLMELEQWIRSEIVRQSLQNSRHKESSK